MAARKTFKKGSIRFIISIEPEDDVELEAPDVVTMAAAAIAPSERPVALLAPEQAVDVVTMAPVAIASSVRPPLALLAPEEIADAGSMAAIATAPSTRTVEMEAIKSTLEKKQETIHARFELAHHPEEVIPVDMEEDLHEVVDVVPHTASGKTKVSKKRCANNNTKLIIRPNKKARNQNISHHREVLSTWGRDSANAEQPSKQVQDPTAETISAIQDHLQQMTPNQVKILSSFIINAYNKNFPTQSTSSNNQNNSSNQLPPANVILPPPIVRGCLCRVCTYCRSHNNNRSNLFCPLGRRGKNSGCRHCKACKNLLTDEQLMGLDIYIKAQDETPEQFGKIYNINYDTTADEKYEVGFLVDNRTSLSFETYSRDRILKMLFINIDTSSRERFPELLTLEEYRAGLFENGANNN